MAARRLRPRCGAARVAALCVAALVLAGAVLATAGGRGPPGQDCRGAQARDPARPCSAAAWGSRVVPTPAEARRAGNSPCTVLARRVPLVCAFGVRERESRATVAVIGDSHAVHWRAALEVVARRQRWRGLSLTRLGCFLSRATKRVPEPLLSQCLAWRRAVLAWLRARPEVRTIVVSQLVGGSPVRGVRDQWEGRVRGFLAAWRGLPRSVRDVVVLRDTPRASRGTAACVERAMAAGRAAGPACALPRSRVLARDPAVEAARRWRSSRRRVHVIDLTSFMCDRRRCFPVVGGTLVFKDDHHLTAAFGTTLGPFLDREFRGLPISF